MIAPSLQEEVEYFVDYVLVDEDSFHDVVAFDIN